MSSSPPSSILGTVTQYFPFCTTIITQILTKSEINLMVKLSKSCKYFDLKFFAIVDELEINKNKVKCFKSGKSWNMPLGWILKYGITVTDKLSINLSNPLIITRLLAKIQYSTIEELIISESYVSKNDISRLTQSGSIKKFKIILMKCRRLMLDDPLNLISRVPNAVDIHIEQPYNSIGINLNNLQQNAKIQKLKIIGCEIQIFKNNFLKNNLAPKAEVFFGFYDRQGILRSFENTIVEELFDKWDPQEEKPIIQFM